MIPAERAHLNVTAISHPGMTGKNNEDRYGVSAYTTNAEEMLPSLLAVVADGIGGHRAGEVAAEIAVEAISAAVAQSDGSQPVQTLREAIVLAGQAIGERATIDPTLQGMGSTCACAWVIGSRLYTASVGDSRVYLIRENTIRRLTTDHTWVQEAIEHGLLAPEEARKHPNAHVIRRYLGSRQEVVPDTRLRLRPNENDAQAEANQGTELQPGDVLVMCSDGLTDLVDDGEILTALRTRNTRGALEELVRLSNRRGGHDNVTIITLAVPTIERPTIPVVVRRSRKRLVRVLGAAAALGLVLVAVAAGVAWYFLQADLRQQPISTVAPAQPPPATLFPEEATQPAALPLTTQIPVASPTPEGGVAPLVTASPASISTPLSATLTPWPTNTTSP